MMRTKKKQTSPKKTYTEPASSAIKKLFVVDKEALAGALTWLHRIAERHATIPILSTVLLKANRDGLSLVTTDNEKEMAGKIPAQVVEETAFAIPACKLYAIALRMPEKEITFSLVQGYENRIKITSGDVEFDLCSFDAEAFPAMAREDNGVSFDLTAEEFLLLMDTIQFAMSVEETRHTLNGIYLHEKEGNLVAVATDGHRLARVQVPLPTGAKGVPEVIIPRQSVGVIVDLVRERMKPVHLFVSDNQIRFKTDGIEMLSRVIDGTYPDYEKVIPVNNNRVVQVDARAFANALDRMAIVSEKLSGVRLSFSKNTLVFEKYSSDEGRAKDRIPVRYNGDDLEIGFNYRYLLDILAHIKGKNVKMIFHDGVSPVIFKDVADSSVLFVLMPMRV